MILLSLVLVALGSPEGSPVVLNVSPPGGRVGTMVEWNVQGANLERVTQLVGDDDGIKVLRVGPQPPGVKVQVQLAPTSKPGVRELRLDGPNGVSNLFLVRVDELDEVTEREPNDSRVDPQVVKPGQVVSSRLKATDVDWFRLEGRPGQPVELKLEVRELGSTLEPVLSVESTEGQSLGQYRRQPGKNGDISTLLQLPDTGACLIQIRDLTYDGDEAAFYRLRLSTGRDKPPTARSNQPSAGISRLSGVWEPTSPHLVDHNGLVLHGCVGSWGQVVQQRISVRTGELISVRAESWGLGSWLDPVLTIRSSFGDVLAENDDAEGLVRPHQARAVGPTGLPTSTVDSALRYLPKADEVVTLELKDRYGRGGPEYSYKLIVGPEPPDVDVWVLVPRAGVDDRTPQGSSGEWNLKPGESARLRIAVVATGKPGPAEIRIDNLPPGVTAEPIRVRLPGPKSPVRATDEPVMDVLTLRVSPQAPPALSFSEVKVRFKQADGTIEERAGVGLANLGSRRKETPEALRLINRFPIRVIEGR